MSNHRIRVAADNEPFVYDVNSNSLFILGRKDAKVRMRLSDMLAFHTSVVSIKNRYKMIDIDIRNNPAELRRLLSLEKYIKINGSARL